FPHALGDDMRFLLGVVQALLISAFLISDELEEKRDVVGSALVANPFNPGVLGLIDILRIVRCVIQKNLHTVSASFFQAASRPVIEPIGQAAGTSLVISSLLIGEQ